MSKHLPSSRYTYGVSFGKTFHLKNPLKYLDESAVRCVCLSYLECPFEVFGMSLLTPKWPFSQSFSILELVKLLPFYIPPAWKRRPFRTEPPSIVHYRECPPGRSIWTALIVSFQLLLMRSSGMSWGFGSVFLFFSFFFSCHICACKFIRARQFLPMRGSGMS